MTRDERMARNAAAMAGDSSKPRPVYAGRFKGRAKVSEVDVLRWCFENVDAVDVTPESAPSAGAWSLLQRLRKDPEMLDTFYKTVWTKLLPSKAQLEGEKRLSDDGREQIELCDKLLELSKEAHSGRTQPAGPAGGDQPAPAAVVVKHAALPAPVTVLPGPAPDRGGVHKSEDEGGAGLGSWPR